jgi:hypothetical protein
MAVGPNHIFVWVNAQFVIFSKTGTVVSPPANGNIFWNALPGHQCGTTNRGDPLGMLIEVFAIFVDMELLGVMFYCLCFFCTHTCIAISSIRQTC